MKICIVRKLIHFIIVDARYHGNLQEIKVMFTLSKNVLNLLFTNGKENDLFINIKKLRSKILQNIRYVVDNPAGLFLEEFNLNIQKLKNLLRTWSMKR